MSPKETEKKRKRKNKAGAVAPQESEAGPVRRRPRWYHIVFPFLVILFGFGGTDALLMRNPFAFANALFLIVLIFWNTFFPRIGRNRAAMISVLAFGAYLGSLFFLLPPPRISKETTYLTEPRNREGKSLDYFKAIEQDIASGNPVTENGYRDYVAALGPEMILLPSNHREEKAVYWRQLCEKLEIDSRNTDFMPYIGAESYFFKTLKDSPPQAEGAFDVSNMSARQLCRHLSETPWNAEQFPIAEEWFQKNRHVLELFCDALRKPDFLIPMLRREDTQPLRDLPQLYNSILPLSRDLGILVQREIGNGNIEKAWELNELQFRLAETLFRQNVGYQGVYVASDVWDRGVDSMISLFHHAYENGPLDELENRFKEREKYLTPLDEETMKRILTRERLLVLDRVQSLAWGRTGWRGGGRNDEGSPEETEYPPLFRRLLRMFYWNETLKNVNSYYDWLEQSEAAAERIASVLPVRSNETEFENIIRLGIFRATPSRLGYREIYTRIDAARAYEKELFRIRIRAAMVKTAFYLEKYRLENDGLYPSNWVGLFEKYGDDIPHDPAQAPQPPVYQSLFENRGYLLYSVGPNGQDDGGASTADSKGSDDIAIRKNI